MRKITLEEAAGLTFARKGIRSELGKQLQASQVGDSFILSQDEWKHKSAPGGSISAYSKRLGMKFSCFALVGGGWLVQRKA